MDKTKREKTIKVRVSEDEHEALLHMSTKTHLAQWMRETCLNPTADWVSEKPAAKADPELLRALAGIGNNINQIARKINMGEWGVTDKVEILAALREIEQKL